MSAPHKAVPRPTAFVLTDGHSVVAGSAVKGVGVLLRYGSALKIFMLYTADGRTFRVTVKDQTDPVAADWLRWATDFVPCVVPNRDCPETASWAAAVPCAKPPARFRLDGVDVSRVARNWGPANDFAETHASIKKHCGPWVCKACGAVLSDTEFYGAKHTASKTTAPACRTAGTGRRDREAVRVTLSIREVCELCGIGYDPLEPGGSMPDEWRRDWRPLYLGA